MDNAVFAVYGAGGFGREVMTLLRQHCMSSELSAQHMVFIDDGIDVKQVNGHDRLNYDEFLARDATAHHVVIAIANSHAREKLMRRCQSDNVQSLSLVASNAIVMDEVKTGVGSILSPFVTIGSNVEIGKGFHANVYSYIAHDCRIGDFVTFAPAVTCNGNVMIEDHAYIGAGAIIRQGAPEQPIVIGRGAVVGMGAVVTKSVPPGTTVAGNPARPLNRH